MKRTLKIVGSILGIICAMLLIRDSISGIINSYNNGTWNIFAIVMLPFLIVFMAFAIIVLIQSLRNKLTQKNIFMTLAIVLSFVIGLLYIWFAIVKADNTLYNAIIGTLTMLTGILFLYK